MSMITKFQPETITQQIRDHITQELAYDRVNLVLTNEFKLFEQGIIDSLGILRLISFIEERFGLPLEAADMTLENFATIEDISALIVGKLSPA